MTAISDRPQMMPEDFEELAHLLARTAEGIRLEFIYGKLGVKPVPDGDHSMIIEWLTRICMQARPELWLYNHGLKVQSYRDGRAHPDGALAPHGTVAGQGEWADSDGILMVVEVTSYDSDTERRDRIEKPRAYAETGIPMYLLIDRDSAEVTVFSRPNGVRYEIAHTVPFGRTVRLPDPVGITLDTEPLKNWVR
ncbi:Uma2 family endonuclease [Kitasatospora sp. NPDC093550]|uniref:Uma2 family endonuclease n=1 Tax=Kitasatospora sp. NPDC093550 TaxID=3364089 RepID=UPI00382275A2